jgi:two-component system sensor kinase
VATSIRDAIQDELASQERALLSLAAFWPADLDSGFAPALRADADRLLHAHPGLDRIAVFDRESGEPLFVSAPIADAPPAPANGPEGPAPLPSDEAHWLTIDSMALHADTGTAGEDDPVAYHIHLPIGLEESTGAHLVAHFDPARLLVDFFRGRSESYAIEVRSDGIPIYARGEPSSDPWQSWWKVASTLPLPDGGRWEFVYRPTPEYASARLTAVPHYVLFLGLSLSACLAFLTHELRRTRRQSRSLGVANASLQERGRELLRLNEELEHRVVERTRELEDAVVELRAFNYSVSHDLRSPLGAVLNFASILKEDYPDRPLDDEGLRILERIMASAKRATLLLEDLLELSKAGRAELEMEDVDMTRLAASSFQQAAAAEGPEAQDVELRIDPLPSVQGDPQLLDTVFGNLFSNALKYSRGQEKPRIHVSGEIQGDEAIFTVADNGSGFDMRFASKLFEVFERLHHEDEVEGSGVGLAIVARIVKRHQGRIWGTGEVGRGARFSFALPLRRGSGG